jgi:hypothetical protein
VDLSILSACDGYVMLIVVYIWCLGW